MNKQHKGCIDFNELVITSLQDPKEAIAYLNAALEECKDGSEESQKLLLLALRNVAIAQGGLQKLSDKTKLGRESLYKTLSKKGNPKLTTLTALINAMGFDLQVTLSQKR